MAAAPANQAKLIGDLRKMFADIESKKALNKVAKATSNIHRITAEARATEHEPLYTGVPKNQASNLSAAAEEWKPGAKGGKRRKQRKSMRRRRNGGRRRLTRKH